MRVQVHEMVKLVKEYKPAAQEAMQNMKLADKRAQQAAAGASRAQPSPQQRAARAGDTFSLNIPMFFPGADACSLKQASQACGE